MDSQEIAPLKLELTNTKSRLIGAVILYQFLTGLYGAPKRPTNRNGRDMHSEHVEQLFRAMREEGAVKLLEMLTQKLAKEEVWRAAA